MLAFLVGDIGWAVISQMGLELGVVGTHLLDMAFLTAYSLLGVGQTFSGGIAT